MSQRLAALIALAGFAVLVIGALITGGNLGLAEAPQARIAFQIATGSTEGVYFPVGQAMAGLISHPAGVGRCETATVCGPAGVILSARTSNGAADNLRAINQGLVDSGLAQGDAVAAAVKGQGLFRRAGPARHLRVIASLFAEDVHLVVAAKSRIRDVADLRGKRVMLGNEGSGSVITARAILTAWRLPEKSLRLVPPSAGNGAQLLREGKLDAFFTVAGVPLDAVRDLMRDHQARLVPIDGVGRDRLVQQAPQLAPAMIAANAYPGSPAIETVATRAYWVTRDGEPDALIYGITRALFNQANRNTLTASHPSAHDIGLDKAALDPPAPLHPGAARFYKEAGVIPR
jgi:TRAP transporter TAXI family solute receptor